MLAATAAAPGAGGRHDPAVCTNRFDARVIPGFTLVAGSDDHDGMGTGDDCRTRRIWCCRATGVGTAGIHYAYTCGRRTGTWGTGTVSVSIPTTGGTRHLVGALERPSDRTRHPCRGALPLGACFSGVGFVIPTHGTRFVTPLTRAVGSVSGGASGA